MGDNEERIRKRIAGFVSKNSFGGHNINVTSSRDDEGVRTYEVNASDSLDATSFIEDCTKNRFRVWNVNNKYKLKAILPRTEYTLRQRVAIFILSLLIIVLLFHWYSTPLIEWISPPPPPPPTPSFGSSILNAVAPGTAKPLGAG